MAKQKRRCAVCDPVTASERRLILRRLAAGATMSSTAAKYRRTHGVAVAIVKRWLHDNAPGWFYADVGELTALRKLYPLDAPARRAFGANAKREFEYRCDENRRARELLAPDVSPRPIVPNVVQLVDGRGGAVRFATPLDFDPSKR